MRGVLLSLLLPVAAQAGEHSFTIEPPPAWVEIRPLDEPLSIPADQLGNGEMKLLEESQTQVSDAGVSTFFRDAKKVLSPSAMDAVSTLKFKFDPPHEHLVIHGIWIQRGGQRLDALIPDDVKVIQQEKALDRQIYDGSLTAVIFLKDVRVGDIVETAYSKNGQNPIFGSHYLSSFDLGGQASVGRIFHRLLYPEGRPLFIKPHRTTVTPAISTKDGVREYRWNLTHVQPLVSESGVPAWYEAWPWVQLSSFETWGEVAQWAMKLFTPEIDPSASTASTDALIEEWKKASPTPEGRLLAATRFVQDDVRYLGIEMGANSHQPHAPAKVLEQRFGDCKDKALLLATLLRRLGIEADPALVSSRSRRGIEEHHPWPYAFDHVIVKAVLDGREVWIDGTASLERGPAAIRPPPRFERALLVRADSTALVTIPTAKLDSPTMDTEENYDVTQSGTATLDVRTRFHGDDAWKMRLLLASHRHDELQKHFLNEYANDDPGITVSRPLEVKDDPDTNTVELQQHYSMPNFWRGQSHSVSPSSFDSALGKPMTSVRTMPLEVEPANLRHVISLNLAESSGMAFEAKTVSGPAAVATFNGSSIGNQLRLEFTYRTLAETVEPASIKLHLDALEQMRHLGVSLPGPATFGGAVGEQTPIGRIRNLLISLLVAVAVIWFVVRSSRQPSGPKARNRWRE